MKFCKLLKYKFAGGFTDCCAICENFKKIKNPTDDQKKIFEIHKNLKDQQINKKNKLKNPKEQELLVLFDFKENIKIGKNGDVQIQQNFFNTKSISTFGIVMFYNENGITIRKFLIIFFFIILKYKLNFNFNFIYFF